MRDANETPAAAFDTSVTIPPDLRAEFAREIKALSSTRMLASLRIADDDAPLVSRRLIETAHGCETLSAWTGWRLPPAHQRLPAASIVVGRLFEHRASVVVVVSGKADDGHGRRRRRGRSASPQQTDDGGRSNHDAGRFRQGDRRCRRGGLHSALPRPLSRDP
jgi:hypothetical protein